MENCKKTENTNVCSFSPEWLMWVGKPSVPDNVGVSSHARWNAVFTKWSELVFLMSFYVPVRAMRFNTERAAPDVSQEEHSHSYSVTCLPTETGFRYISLTGHSLTNLRLSPTWSKGPESQRHLIFLLLIAAINQNVVRQFHTMYTRPMSFFFYLPCLTVSVQLWYVLYIVTFVKD